jgi:hypothetical protein
MQPCMMTIDGERNRPRLFLKRERSAVVSVWLLLAFLVIRFNSFLKFVFCLSKIVQKARDGSVRPRLECLRKPTGFLGNLAKMINKSLAFVCFVIHVQIPQSDASDGLNNPCTAASVGAG